ncbi:WD40 repeat domain-containing protein [filamentous cyanobacterium Phorm 46]|nr:WD40 repeat domain-containing protein [filamentous cyanobacterium Phorm 46]
MSDLSVWLAQQSKSEREYLLKYQPRDFVEGLRDFNGYYRWVTDFGLIEAKLELSGVQPLIEDYDLARISDVFLSEGQTETLKLIQGAIRKSAHVLEKDKTQLVEHLWGRLLDFEMPEIQRLLEQARQSKDSVWLRPLKAKANLERAGEGCLRTLTGHTSGVRGVAIAPDGKTAISASWDQTLKIWDTDTGAQLRTLIGHTDRVLAVAIAPDGKTAISASWDQTLKIWDTETGAQLRTLIGHTDRVLAVAIAPDGKTAISASYDKTLKIWDTETGCELKTLTGHGDWVNAVAIAPDGKTAISASGDETLKIWDTETGRELKTLTGHSSGVNAVAIAPDGKTAISASRDHTLKVWDLLTGKEVASFSGESAFSGCAIAPDGVTVVAGDASGRVHFLRLEGMGDLGDV